MYVWAFLYFYARLYVLSLNSSGRMPMVYPITLRPTYKSPTRIHVMPRVATAILVSRPSYKKCHSWGSLALTKAGR